MLDIFRQRAEFEVFWNSFHAPGLGYGLKHSDHHLAGIFLVVVANGGLPDHRQVSRQVRNGFGDHIKMLGGMKGDGNTCLQA